MVLQLMVNNKNMQQVPILIAYMYTCMVRVKRFTRVEECPLQLVDSEKSATVHRTNIYPRSHTLLNERKKNKHVYAISRNKCSSYMRHFMKNCPWKKNPFLRNWIIYLNIFFLANNIFLFSTAISFIYIETKQH